MPASVTFRIRVGPWVFFQIDGPNCKEVASAMDGYEDLNKKIDAMFSDLAQKIYPDGLDQVTQEMESEDEV
jgi:hypothetical protein